MKSNTQLKEYTFVFLGNSRFGGLYHREHALAAELARQGHAVTFVEEMPSLASKTRDWVRSWTNGARKPAETHEPQLPEGVNILIPPTVPTFFRSSYTPAVDRFLFRRWFRESFRGQDWSHTVLIVTLPYWWLGFIDRQLCPAKSIVYDCHDAIEMPSRNAKALDRMRRSEDKIIKDADLITYSARSMESILSRRSMRNNLCFLPNAVSSGFIDKAIVAGNHKRNRIIGYVGSLDEKRIDGELLLKTVMAHKDLSFEFVGPIDPKMLRCLESAPNVAFPGIVHHTNVPSILVNFNVLLMPFKRNNITDVVNPLKLYEYCASGNPIVAMRTKELNHYSRLLYLADSPEDFVRLIRIALKDKNRTKRAARKRFARNNTWSHRIDVLLSAIGKMR